MKDQIETKVIDILSNRGFGDAETNLETKFDDDLGMDSLDIAELIEDTERDFNINIPGGVAEEIHTVGDLVDYIDTAIRERI